MQRVLSDLQVQKTLISAERSSNSRYALWLMEDFPMRECSMPMVHLLKVSEDSPEEHYIFIEADAERSL